MLNSSNYSLIELWPVRLFFSFVCARMKNWQKQIITDIIKQNKKDIRGFVFFSHVYISWAKLKSGRCHKKYISAQKGVVYILYDKIHKKGSNKIRTESELQKKLP